MLRAKVSIVLSTLYPDEQETYKTAMSIKYDEELFCQKIRMGDSDDFVLVVTDREISYHEALAIYLDIIGYQQGIGEDLTDEELVGRDKEVQENWFNGNFTLWTVDEAKGRYSMLELAK